MDAPHRSIMGLDLGMMRRRNEGVSEKTLASLEQGNSKLIGRNFEGS